MFLSFSVSVQLLSNLFSNLSDHKMNQIFFKLLLIVSPLPDPFMLVGVRSDPVVISAILTDIL